MFFPYVHALTRVPWSFDQSKRKEDTRRGGRPHHLLRIKQARRTAASSSSHQPESANNSGSAAALPSTVRTSAMEAELPTWPVHCSLSSSSLTTDASTKSTAARPASPTSGASIRAGTAPPAVFLSPAAGLMPMVQHSSLSAPQRHKPGRQRGAPWPGRPLGSDLHGGGAPPAGVAGAMHSSLISFSGMVVAAYAQTRRGAEIGSRSHLRAQRFFPPSPSAGHGPFYFNHAR